MHLAARSLCLRVHLGLLLDAAVGVAEPLEVFLLGDNLELVVLHDGLPDEGFFEFEDPAPGGLSEDANELGVHYNVVVFAEGFNGNYLVPYQIGLLV
jgi:hypothetical protein